MTINSSWRRSLDIEISRLLCRANKWTGFYMYMIRTSVIKELKTSENQRYRGYKKRKMTWCVKNEYFKTVWFVQSSLVLNYLPTCLQEVFNEKLDFFMQWNFYVKISREVPALSKTYAGKIPFTQISCSFLHSEILRTIIKLELQITLVVSTFCSCDVLKVE